MTQQKSEDRDKPQGRRKSAVTREVESRAGGEAIPVDEAPKQLLLFAETADALVRASGRDEADRSLERPATTAAQKPATREKTARAATMDVEQRWLAMRDNNVAPAPASLVLA
jgi:hypothetical protein